MVTVCNLPLPVKIEAELYFLKFQKHFFLFFPPRHKIQLDSEEASMQPNCRRKLEATPEMLTQESGGERDKFPPPAGKAAFHQVCSVLMLPSRAEMAKRAPLHLTQWLEEERDVMLGSEIICVFEAECYYHTSQGLNFKKEKYKDWKLVPHKLRSA